MHRHPIQTVKVFLPFFLICSYIFSDKTRVHLQFKAPENRKSGSISATAWHSARAWPRLSLYFSRPRDLFIFRSDLFKWFVHFHVIFTRVVLYIPWHAVVMIDSHICLITYWPQCHMGLFELTCAISGHDVKCTRYCSHVLDILLTWSHVKRTWLLSVGLAGSCAAGRSDARSDGCHLCLKKAIFLLIVPLYFCHGA